ncbi:MULTISPECIES: ribbon-helix-helix domain-containing protein [Klebsiella]|uniref:Ribbon-helix-helix domain-containing protein n=2 Tax=Klebsiella pneumoniae TaxID=573 RepID=A0A483TPI5_KLEPN|nr:hypothetical protein DBV09_09470 [Klebsiella pneumoniae]MDK1811909.1 ribbon-helix-helix domain-containing protein [Klebsiella sp. K5-314]ROG17289.1 ribbon-helix-helix domain-containing protein [Klebsiella pneumoniae subsp. pneumoniae]HEP0717259.1 ribbon-helix-helix domain-containing protein [Klebsiella pneumoniae subsp. ozaenae]EIW8710432.1 ribbon-helix-helix domain-containing protein [Klebsiella pneumoniae]
MPKSQLLDEAIKDLFKKYGVMDCSNDLNKSAHQQWLIRSGLYNRLFLSQVDL